MYMFSYLRKYGDNLFPPFPLSYYPLLPAFRRDDHSATASTPTSAMDSQASVENELTELNMNFIDAFENGHALMSVMPDILILPSDLKPFIKV